MQIGQRASRSGASVDTVRYYERHRILPPPLRRASGYRAYTDDDLARLRYLLRANSLGFTLREIQELLALSQHRGHDMAGLHEAADAKLRDVEEKLHALHRIRHGLAELVAACPGQRPLERCPIPDTSTLEEDA